MKTGQRIIKYLALAFGIFLSVIIIYAIAKTVIVIATYSGDLEDFISINIFKDKEYINEKFSNNISEEFDEIKALNIVCNVSKLNVKSSDKVKVEANNVTDSFYIELTQDGVLNINDKINSNSIGFKNGVIPEVTIYVTDKELENVKITTGASNTNISGIFSNEFQMELGAGNVKIENINVKGLVKIDSGVGNLNIDKSVLNNLDLNLGVGSTNISSSILGKSDIDCGVGNLNLTLNGKKDDYQIKVKTGLGNMIIDGKKVHSDMLKYLNGENVITVEGGMGNVRIDFSNL